MFQTALGLFQKFCDEEVLVLEAEGVVIEEPSEDISVDLAESFTMC